MFFPTCALACSVPGAIAVRQLGPGPQFGRAVATADVNGDGFADVLVGEPFYSGTHPEQGRVLLYLGSPQGPEGSPSWVHVGPQERAHLGAALANAGDLNGDGYEDVVIGVPDFDAVRRRIRSGSLTATRAHARRDAGLVAFFLGSPSGLASTPIRFLVGSEPMEHLGVSAASAGDVDADGLPDVIVGATGTAANRGAAFLFLGSTNGQGAFPAAVVLGPAANTRFGFAVGGGGDLDGDGFDDVLVGAPDGGANGFGSAHVYRGSAAGLGTSPAWTLTGSGVDEGDFGAALSIVGDLTRSGFDHAVVGDPLALYAAGGHVTTDHAGSLTAYTGSPAGPVLVDVVYATALAPAGEFEYGRAVCTGSDLDGDGRPECMGGGPAGGVVYAVRQVGFPIQSGGPLRFGSSPLAGFGAALAVGDVDGNGIDDLVVGEPLFDGVIPDAGRVTVLAGKPGFFSSLATTTWLLSAP